MKIYIKDDFISENFLANSIVYQIGSGCTNHSCYFRTKGPVFVGTNGPCLCLKNVRNLQHKILIIKFLQSKKGE